MGSLPHGVSASLEALGAATGPLAAIPLPEPPKNLLEIVALATVLVIALWRRRS